MRVWRCRLGFGLEISIQLMLMKDEDVSYSTTVAFNAEHSNAVKGTAVLIEQEDEKRLAYLLPKWF